MKFPRCLVAAQLGFALCASAAAAQGLVAVDDSYGIPYSSPLTVEAPGVIDNDTFNGGGAADAGATAEILAYPAFGSLDCESNPGTYTLCPDGSFIYTPDPDFPGFDSFTYRLLLNAEVSEATVTLTACTGGPDTYVCWNEDAFLARVAASGYTTFQEGFEDDTAWGPSREPLTAPVIVSQGISWQTNHPDPPASNEITTGGGPARTGLYGMYDDGHGYATGTPTECNIDNPPDHCLYKDGFTGTTEPGTPLLHAAGAHLTGVQPNLVMILDGGAPTSLGKIDIGGHQFFGVIDATGFSSFRIEETDGKVGQSRYVFGDDFILATEPADTTPPQVVLVNSYADTGDGEISEGEVVAVGVSQLIVQFSEPVTNLGDLDNDSVTNPGNYLLVDDGGDGFETTGCAGGVAGNDQPISVDWVSWESGSTLAATLDINGGGTLGTGSYRLFVCGSTSITDWAGSPLDGDGNGTGGDDFIRNFSVDINVPPVANPDSYTVDRGASMSMPAPGVLANDVDSDPLTAQLLSSPSHAASFSFNSDGSFSYTHDGLSVVDDTFTYRAFDGANYSAAATVTVHVNPASFTWYVAPGGNNFNDCLSPGTPCATVAEAVVRAIDGDVIQVASGTYLESLSLDEALTLVGTAPGSVLDGSGSAVVLSVASVAPVTVTGFEIRGGAAGGVHVLGSLTLLDCWIHGNGDGGAGSFGGLLNQGFAHVERSTISLNLGDGSGGIGNYGQLELVNSTITSNLAAYASGIENAIGSVLDLKYSTVADNAAVGIRSDGLLSVEASIISGHTTANCASLLSSLGHNLEDGDSCGLDPVIGDLINSDPLLGALNANGGPTPTMALGAGSPAVDAGDSLACPVTDQRGALRPVDGNNDGTIYCDIGAYEVQEGLLFADGFESGDTSSWSSAVGAP